MNTEIKSCLTETQIKNYISEMLPDKERFGVEDHLLDCPFCADAVEGLSDHYDFEKDSSLEKLDTHFEEKLRREEALIKPLNAPRLFSINRIAAGILFLLLPLAGWMYWTSNVDQNLYASYMPENAAPSATMRSGGGVVALEMPVVQAKKLFAEKRFEASLLACEEVLEKNPQHPLATYYAGLSALESGHSELARHYLSGLRINEPDFYEDATWYLALTEVKAGEKAAAKVLLEELMKLPQGIYFEEVGDLYKRL